MTKCYNIIVKLIIDLSTMIEYKNESEMILQNLKESIIILSRPQVDKKEGQKQPVDTKLEYINDNFLR